MGSFITVCAFQVQFPFNFCCVMSVADINRCNCGMCFNCYKLKELSKDLAFVGSGTHIWGGAFFSPSCV
uniref:Uncharacterized protein n=1 Tax=Rhizophora mucronata TaxID=61149 RepID=A0A2P2NPT3_RHIMU